MTELAQEIALGCQSEIVGDVPFWRYSECKVQSVLLMVDLSYGLAIFVSSANLEVMLCAVGSSPCRTWIGYVVYVYRRLFEACSIAEAERMSGFPLVEHVCSQLILEALVILRAIVEV